MEEKGSSPETDAGGDNLQNVQNQSKLNSASSSSRCIRQSLENLVSTSSISLDLSRKDLQHLTEDIYKLYNLKHLHLEGNSLSVIPEDFFERLPNLVWLDLRYNKFKELPSGIGCHNQLKTLLLERNPIKRLPIELGNLSTLTALNLRHCPLEFPPPEVIQKGLPAILSFLQNCSNQNPDNAEPITSEMPPIEKLNLTDITKSSLDLSDGWPSEEEMIRFQKLRNEIIQDEREEYLTSKIVANESMPTLRRTKNNENISRKSSMVSSRVKKNLLPAVSSYDLIIQSKRAEECRLAALKEMKEKQALFEQRRKDKEVLQKWRKQARVMREKKGLLYTFSPEKGIVGVSQNAPYATDDVKNYDKLEGCKEPTNQDENRERTLNLDAIKAMEDLRAAKYKEVENRIKQHTQMMKERRKKLTGIPQEDMQRASQDFETAEKLEEDLADLRKDLHKEYRFTAFTGDLLTPPEKSVPTPKPQNIFSNMAF
uniref:Leucine-rich repeat-containing protein 27 isoform X2 n=1 Tax=Pogona vitticeps TaxID=103695 RepID=A0ABM5G1G4_9SAUR